MITVPTVLVLGAGASKPYGFPVGRELIAEIVKGLVHNLTKDSFYWDVVVYEDSFGQLTEHFRKQLEASMQPSIDEFLEKRPEFQPLGIVSIARALIPKEQIDKVTKRLGKPYEWYEYLFSLLNTSTPEKFAENKLCIVTFNYDRSLEYFLFSALQSSYELSVKDAAALLDCIPIIHVYGKLGEPHFSSEQGRHYDPTVNNDAIKKCVESLRIIHSGSSDPEVFEQIHRQLLAAQHICYLGFGYHETNMDRMGVRTSPHGSNAQVYGSVYGFGQSQISRVEKLLEIYITGNPRQIHLGNPVHECLKFLQESVPLS